jgi:hypothetical protein
MSLDPESYHGVPLPCGHIPLCYISVQMVESCCEKFNQCCGSGMFIPDPDFSLIPDPGSRIQKPQQKRRVKKICCHTFFCSHKFHKMENILFLKCRRKKIRPSFQRIIELFTQKFVTNL